MHGNDAGERYDSGFVGDMNQSRRSEVLYALGRSVMVAQLEARPKDRSHLVSESEDVSNRCELGDGDARGIGRGAQSKRRVPVDDFLCSRDAL